MNTDKLLQAADDIEAALKTPKGKLHFDMNTFGSNDRNTCGTAACVAGFITARAFPQEYYSIGLEQQPGITFSVPYKAMEVLEVEVEDIDFYDDTQETPNYSLMEELFHARSLEPCFEEAGTNQYAFLNAHRTFIPDMLRWMVANNRYDWLDAVLKVVPGLGSGQSIHAWAMDNE